MRAATAGQRGTATAAPPRLGPIEFTALLAMSMALAALGIDLLLPAFGQIRSDLGLPSDSTAVAGLVTTYFLGLAVGQLFYGPISDRYGRKPLMYTGFAVYGIGALATALAPTLPLLLAGRFLWGLGAAGPRSITLAIVRDRYDGEEMSRAMSLIMAVFILVPVIAPSIGAIGIGLGSWRWLFVACAITAVALTLWTRRMVESLAPENRRELRLSGLADAARIVMRNRLTVGYTLAMTAMYGGFTSYIGSSEIIFGEVFGAADGFPIYFGALAAVMGAAMLLNSRIVVRIGSRRLSHAVLLAYIAASGLLLVLSLIGGGRPSLPVFLVLMGITLASHALAIPNFNALAMGPMGRVAGMASSLIGTVQVAVGALLGTVLDQAFDGTTVPISVGFLFFGVLALVAARWADAGGRRVRRDARTRGHDTMAPADGATA
ncbi:MAG TPA: multidrug effflux MFS transporter [Euzebya sp.]|nr:multidrug effflux MFS transporter [Euzebya sp.]